MDDERFVINDPLKVYVAELENVLLLSSEEEVECIEHVRAGDERAEAAGKRLLEANLKLVVTIAERYPTKDSHILDRIQEGNSGLMTAIQMIRGNPPENFVTYVTPFIEEAIVKAVAATRGNVIPPNLV